MIAFNRPTTGVTVTKQSGIYDILTPAASFDIGLYYIFNKLIKKHEKKTTEIIIFTAIKI